MAYEIPGFSFTLPASTGILNTQFRFVTINASGQAAFPGVTATDTIVGVMTNKPTAEGQAVTVVNDGVVKVEAAGSTASKGDRAKLAADGKVAASNSTSPAVGDIVDGSSGSTGRILSVLLD